MVADGLPELAAATTRQLAASAVARALAEDPMRTLEELSEWRNAVNALPAVARGGGQAAAPSPRPDESDAEDPQPESPLPTFHDPDADPEALAELKQSLPPGSWHARLFAVRAEWLVLLASPWLSTRGREALYALAQEGVWQGTKSMLLASGQKQEICNCVKSECPGLYALAPKLWGRRSDPASPAPAPRKGWHPVSRFLVVVFAIFVVIVLISGFVSDWRREGRERERRQQDRLRTFREIEQLPPGLERSRRLQEMIDKILEPEGER